MAAAAWSWVEKMLQLAQRTSAPNATNVSINTAVWMVMCSEPVMRAPWLGELISQCRAAAAGDAFPLVRYVLDVFVSAGTPEGGG